MDEKYFLKFFIGGKQNDYQNLKKCLFSRQFPVIYVMLRLMNTERISNIVRDYVSEHKRSNPNLSDSQIAHRLGVANSTLHRIINRRSFPSTENLFKLSQSIPEIQNFINGSKTSEEQNKTKTRTRKINIDENTMSEYVGEELENLLADPYLFTAYILSNSGYGVTDEEIKYCIGYEGCKALKILAKKGFVKKDQSGRYKSSDSTKGIILSFKTIKKHLQILIEHYKPDDVRNSYIYFGVETLNTAGVVELLKIHKEAHKKMAKLMTKKEFYGEIPVFSVGCCDKLCIREPENGGLKDEINV